MLSRVKKERKAQIEKITREVFPSLKPYRFRLGKAYFFAKIFVPYLTTAYGQPDKSLISCGFTRLDLFTSTCFCLSWCVHPTDAYAQEYENGQLGKTEMSLTTSVPAFALNALFGRRIAPNRSARSAMCLRAVLSLLSMV